MKIFFLILLLIGGFIYHNETTPWTKERKNKEIAKAIKENKRTILKGATSSPNISDAKVYHDKKNCGMVLKIKLVDMSHLDQAQIHKMAKSLKPIMVDMLEKQNDRDSNALKYILKKGVYIGYKWYYANGKPLIAFKISDEDIHKS